jgi:hypothetical protein
VRTLSSKYFNAYGRRVYLIPEAHHERLEDSPPRYLVDFRAQTAKAHGFGFQIFDMCAVCARAHEVWLTADRFWRRLPKEHQKKKLCVNCFRTLTGRKT